MATTHQLKGIYRVIDKTMYIHFSYVHQAPTGSNKGSGTYKFSLPSGFKVNTSLANVLDLSYSGYGLSLGTGICRQDNYISSCEVVALDSDNLALRTVLSWGLPIVNDGHYGLSMTNVLYSFVAEIPIL
jgi:hypothetical protein